MQLRKLFISMLFILLTSVATSAFAISVSTLFHVANNPVAGNPKGKITIVEFFDYQCSHCISMAPVVDSIIKNNPDVRVVYKDFPIRGPMSDLAARAALAANLQGKYYSVSHAILTAAQPLTEAEILDAAKKTDVNINRLQKDMNSNNIVNQVKANIDLATELKIPGTPAFYIGKTDAKNMDEIKFVMGEMNQLEMQDAINTLRETGKNKAA